MAVGLPVVAHDYEVTRWIFGDYPGLVDALDEAALVAAVSWAVREGRTQSAARSASAADRFAWSKIAKQYREFFFAVYQHHQGIDAIQPARGDVAAI